MLSSQMLWPISCNNCVAFMVSPHIVLGSRLTHVPTTALHRQSYLADGARLVGVKSLLVRQAGGEDLRRNNVGDRREEFGELARQADEARGALGGFCIAGVGNDHGLGFKLLELVQHFADGSPGGPGRSEEEGREIRLDHGDRSM